jgi:AmiR/NasT family two-component response regulator
MSTLDARPDALEECEEELGNLREKIVSLPSIEQAKGILISQEGCSDDEAFEILKTASMRENRKLRDIATEFVRSARQRAHGRRRRPPG